MSERLKEGTILLTNFFYGIVKINFALITSNLLFLIALAGFRFTWSNLLVFLGPLVLLTCSLKAGFLTVWDLLCQQDSQLWRQYGQHYKVTFKSSLKLFCGFMPILALIWLNLRIATNFPELSFMKIPLLLTLLICLTGELYLLEEQAFQGGNLREMLKEGLIFGYRHLVVVAVTTLGGLVCFVVAVLHPVIALLILPGFALTAFTKLIQISLARAARKVTLEQN